MSKAYNIISLEISGTELAKKVRPPSLVSEIDWVDNYWDFGSGGKVAAMRDEEQRAMAAERVNDDKTKPKKARAPWPKVQLYCLVS